MVSNQANEFALISSDAKHVIGVKTSTAPRHVVACRIDEEQEGKARAIPE